MDIRAPSQFIIHTNSHAEVFQCSNCNKAFSERKRYNQHLNTHTKPFKCETCTKGFALRSDLARHVRTRHRVAQPRHPCPFADCGFSVTRKDNIKQHLRHVHASNLPHRHTQKTSQAQVATSQPTPDKTTHKSILIPNESTVLSPNLLPTVFVAASAGNVTLLQQMHQSGIDMHTIADDGCNTLHTAARAGKEQATRYLLELGVSPYLRNHAHRRPDQEAALSGNWETLRLFLQHDENPSIDVTYYVLKSGNNSMLSGWVRYCYDHINHNKELEIFRHAAKIWDTSAMRTIISCESFSPNITDRLGQAPIHYAAGNDYADILRLLISHPNIDINLAAQRNMTYGQGLTPVQIAIKNGSKNAFDILLADNRTQWKYKKSWPQQELLSCLVYRRFELGLVLFENHWPGERDINYQLVCASIRGDECQVLRLASRESLTTTENRREKLLNPFYWAIAKGHCGIVKLLMDRPKNDLDRLLGNLIPLDLVVRRGDREMLSLLLSHPRTQLGKGRPLYYAVKKNNIDMVRMLLVCHDINTRRGLPLLVAIQREHLSIVELLVFDERVDVNEWHWYHGTPLMCAVKQNSVELVQLIFARRVSPQVHVNEFRSYYVAETALDIALERKRSDIIELLRSHGAKTYKELKDSESTLPISAGSRTDTTNTLFETQGYSRSKVVTDDPSFSIHGQSILNAAPVQDATSTEQDFWETEDNDTGIRLGGDFNMEDWLDRDDDTQDWFEEGHYQHD